MLKTAIVGCGSIAGVHGGVCEALDRSALIAFADIIPERARSFAEQYGGNAYASLEGLLERERPDVLHICTPHYLHTAMALQAKAAGVHVFLEKPPATTRTDWRLLEESFQESETRLGICFQNRFNGSVRRVRELLESNAYGNILGARAFVTWHRTAPYYTESGWRGKWPTEGGGVLINQSVHTLDLLVYLLGTPTAVEASCANHHLKDVIEVEDTVEAYVGFGDKSALFYATTANCFDSPVLLDIACKNGRIRIEGDTVTEYPAEGEAIATDYSKSFLGKDYWGSGHNTCIGEFYRCIEKGEDFPIGIDAVKNTMNLMLGIYESSATRQPVSLG